MSPEVRRELQRLFGEGTIAGMTDAQLLRRFVSLRDEVAFSALVTRHGPMVLGVCRGVIGDEHEAEDAFQATFLVLARKARSLQVKDSLGGWLHRVSRRIAVENNRRSARRRKVEKSDHRMDVVTATSDPTRDGLVSELHEEIDRLPAKYRNPVILCDLQSFTRDEAASRLGWPPGTVAGRLARARALLRDRLTRRGLMMAAGALSVPRELSAAVPAQWAEKTASVALAYLSRDKAIGIASATALSLAEGVLTMMRRWMLIRLALVLVPSTFLIGALAVAALAEPEVKTAITGRVVGPDGKPWDGVRVFYSMYELVKFGERPVVEVTPDADGQIRLEAPPVTGHWSYRESGTLWAYKPGSLVGAVPVHQGTNPPGVPVPLAVGPPSYTPFEVRDPDGKPVAGATIEPQGLKRDRLVVPDSLGELIAAETVTDAKGRAVLKAFVPEEIKSLNVTAPGFGRQRFEFGPRDNSTGVRVLSLSPIGRLKGRLTGDPALIRRRRLLVSVRNPKRGTSPQAVGGESLTTDDEGRFEVSELVAGRLSISSAQDFTAPFYFRTDLDAKIEPGKTTEIELAPKKSVRVSGIVREKETGKPLVGVEVGLPAGLSHTVTTDQEGHYLGFDFDMTQHIVLLPKAPKGYVLPYFVRANLKFPVGVAEIEMPPIELFRAGSIHGVVVDAPGNPVAGAEVTASWIVDEGHLRKTEVHATVRSAVDGRFTINEMNLGGDVTLVAEHLGLRTPQAVVARIGAEEPVRLQIDDSRAVSLTGRVVDPDGKPIAGANVHFRHATKLVVVGRDKERVTEEELVDFAGAVILIADADGRYRTPKQLDRDATYCAYATFPGRVTSHTDWTKGDVGSFADVTLAPESR